MHRMNFKYADRDRSLLLGRGHLPAVREEVFPEQRLLLAPLASVVADPGSDLRALASLGQAEQERSSDAVGVGKARHTVSPHTPGVRDRRGVVGGPVCAIGTRRGRGRCRRSEARDPGRRRAAATATGHERKPVEVRRGTTARKREVKAAGADTTAGTGQGGANKAPTHPPRRGIGRPVELARTAACSGRSPSRRNRFRWD